jgi:hypothetical protein
MVYTTTEIPKEIVEEILIPIVSFCYVKKKLFYHGVAPSSESKERIQRNNENWNNPVQNVVIHKQIIGSPQRRPNKSKNKN